jgi:disulfide bond formation protein DsbB
VSTPRPCTREVTIHRFTASQKTIVFIALVAAWIATLGSLYLSEILHFVPCTLCWYQRILMYPLAIILLVGLLRKDRGIFTYVLPFSVLGIGVSTYHYLLQKTNLFASSAVCDTGIPCTTTWINFFGFVTIPFLALIAFLTISLMGALFFTLEPEAEEA